MPYDVDDVILVPVIHIRPEAALFPIRGVAMVVVEEQTSKAATARYDNYRDWIAGELKNETEVALGEKYYSLSRIK